MSSGDASSGAALPRLTDEALAKLIEGIGTLPTEEEMRMSTIAAEEKYKRRKEAVELKQKRAEIAGTTLVSRRYPTDDAAKRKLVKLRQEYAEMRIAERATEVLSSSPRLSREQIDRIVAILEADHQVFEPLEMPGVPSG